jgi:hypothetical protein
MDDETMDMLRVGGLTELLIAIDCGQLKDLACLCDERVREAASLLQSRFSTRERNILWKRICATCGPTRIPNTTTGTTVPIGTTTTPPPAASKPVPTPPASKPAPDCLPGLPPANSFT